jgi:hypothetical protein
VAVSDIGSRLRTTSDALLADLEQLEALEQQKRELEPGDPRVVELAAAVEEVARRVLGQTVRQREMASVARDLVEVGSESAPDAPIEQTPREIHVILAEWRDAERRAQVAPAGSPEAARAGEDVERLRDEYRAAHEAARRR